MNAKERMEQIAAGRKPDRIPFMPTIAEHSAGVIGKTPSEAARDADMLAHAQIAAYERYGQDAVLVGLDIYNIEAESLGCVVAFHQDASVPGIATRRYSFDCLPKRLEFSQSAGRIGLMLRAAEKVHGEIGGEVNVSVGICGPFSLACELVGYENAVCLMIEDPERMRGLLSLALGHQKEYCAALARRGVGVTIFESWSSPPLLTPGLFREFSAPYAKALIRFLLEAGFRSAPLVIGGDTTSIVEDILETGTTQLVADYMVDAGLYLHKAREKNVFLRVNIDPKLIESGGADAVVSAARGAVGICGGYNKFILGTGVVPYGTPPQNLLAIREFLCGRD